MSLRGKGKPQVDRRTSEPPSPAVTVVHVAGQSSDSPQPPPNDKAPASPLASNTKATPAPSPMKPTSVASHTQPSTAPRTPPPPSPFPSPTPSRTSTWGRRRKNSADVENKGSRSSWYVSWPARSFNKGKGKALDGSAVTMKNGRVVASKAAPVGPAITIPSNPETQTNGKAPVREITKDPKAEEVVPETEVPVVAPEGQPDSIAKEPPSEPAPASPTRDAAESSSSQTDEAPSTTEAAEAQAEIPATLPSSASQDDSKTQQQQGSWLWWGWGKTAPASSPASQAPAAEPETLPRSLPQPALQSVPETEVLKASTATDIPTEQESTKSAPAPVPEAPSQSSSQAQETTASQVTPVQPRPTSWWFWGAAAKPHEVPETPKSTETDKEPSTMPKKDPLSQTDTHSESEMPQEPERPPNTTEPQPQAETNSGASSVINATGTIATAETAQNSVTRSSAWAFWPKVNRSTDTFHSATSIAPPGEPVSRTESPAPGGSVRGNKSKSQPPTPPSGIVDAKAGKTVAVAGGFKPTEISDAAVPANTAVKKVIEQPPSPAKNQLQKLQNNQRTQAPNHVFPSLDSCFWKIDEPSLFGRLARVFTKPQPSKKHLYLTADKPRVRKAVAIGVHGFFPMKLVRTVLGEPTGTSRRFATHAASAIKRWAEKEGIEVEVEAIALEGEGKVADRVEMLWKLLGNWMDHVKNADFVMVAAHSQGVVVGMKLLARMIEYGCVDNARVGFLAMAGINLGPFYHLPTTLLSGSAKELFEFQRTDSLVSRRYIQAIRTVLAHHCRILYVGSIDDQLVPLESSTFANINHPYIFRAVFVDGRVHAPDFLAHLVGFALKLRNLGISDHGLIRELSTPLAGSLYGGEGHSRIYDDGACYDLAIRHALETTECPEVPLRVEPFELPSNTNNPFFLPWAMRGLLEEEFVRTALHRESRELLEQFERWKPSSKVLRDVKFRLEGIRSKL